MIQNISIILLLLFLQISSVAQPNSVIRLQQRKQPYTCSYAMSHPEALNLTQKISLQKLESTITQSAKLTVGTQAVAQLKQTNRKHIWLTFPNGATVFRQSGLPPVSLPMFAFTPLELFGSTKLSWSKQGNSWFGEFKNHHITITKQTAKGFDFELTFQNYGSVQGTFNY